ncbi:4169_t:CDS:2 [Paraglomus brasilianum]|uniref:4169_t:CDS:1 n=1 Tax=Paraglomus brasilianum TaxID=144538 RepID=A0A9N9B2A4_9GLOM|nr:4169_t:CDS:2 [Paraglomus brasilianum]
MAKHRHNVLHNDIRKENIILSNDGKSVFIIDFGLATIDNNRESPNLYEEDLYSTSDYELHENLESGKTIMESNFLNGIIDLTDANVKNRLQSTLDQKQRSWLDRVLEKQSWIPTPEFKDFCFQFTDDVRDRVQIPPKCESPLLWDDLTLFS